MRVVLDTNALLAAFAARGLCESLVAVCLHAHEIVLSEYILGELDRNLEVKLRMPSEQRREIESLLREHATVVVPAALATGSCRDASDLPVLGTAVAGNADALVTGDAQLLTLAEFRGVPILSPRAFYDRLG